MNYELIRFDCRYFIGEKPCRFKLECDSCDRYSPMGVRICIIKFGALGDVLRTTPLLYALREKYPVCHITWVTDTDAIKILSRNTLIDRLFSYSPDVALRFQIEEFDVLINLEKAVEACLLASNTKSGEKYGFGLSRYGTICPINDMADYAFRLGISDELKFRKNEKTYQEIAFETVGLRYKGEPYIINLNEDDLAYAETIFKEKGIRKDDIKIGLNTGSGVVFATKRWTIEGFAGLSDILSKKLETKVMLLGGPEEEIRNREIFDLTKMKPVNIGTNHCLTHFAAIVSMCDLLVTGDTLALHFAIGLGVPTVAIFTSTCAQELDLYGKGLKMVADVECTPCYRSSCGDMKCASSISASDVFDACVEILRKTKDTRLKVR
ncbi:MAG: glycosyltransferase family 9 protein [Nitrospirota bacterium]